MSESSGARPFALAGTQRVYERPRPFTIRHIALDLTLHLKERAIGGSAELEVTRVDPAAEEIALDAVGFEIERIELLAQVQAERIQIISTECSQQMALTRRLEDIEEASSRWGLVKSFAKAAFGVLTGSTEGLQEFLMSGAEVILAGTSDDKYDIEV